MTALPARPVLLGRKVSLVRKAPWVRKDHLVPLALLVRRAKRDFRGRRARKACGANKVFLGRLVRKATEGSKAQPDRPARKAIEASKVLLQTCAPSM